MSSAPIDDAELSTRVAEVPTASISETVTAIAVMQRSEQGLAVGAAAFAVRRAAGRTAR